MQNNIKFSIVVPIYNVEKYLSKCLDSLVNQTYSNIEIICVNDGSTDSSLQILEEYARKDERIKIINQENQGVSAARNNGIDNATGDYFLFVDPDDLLDIHASETLTQIITETQKPDIVQFDVDFIDKNIINRWTNISKYDSYRNNVKKVLFEDDALSYLQLLKCYNCWDKAYKADYIKTNNICFDTDVAIGEDALFVYNILVNNPSIFICRKVLYYYFKHTNSATQHENKFDIFKKHLNYEIKLRDFIYKYKQKYYIKYFYQYLFTCYIGFWSNLYFSSHKAEYLKRIDNFMAFGDNFGFNAKRAKKHLLLAKLHLSWWYWKLIRPIGKYCVVLPYRRFKEFLRSRNG